MTCQTTQKKAQENCENISSPFFLFPEEYVVDTHKLFLDKTASLAVVVDLFLDKSTDDDDDLLQSSSPMKSSTTLAVVVAAALACTTTAFQATSPLSITHQATSATTLYEYIPSGFTKQSWAEFKKKEAEKKKANLGRVGPKGFQSRSMQSFQEALERGEAEHLLPVFNAKEKVAKGLLKVEDIPYMQRGELIVIVIVLIFLFVDWVHNIRVYAGIVNRFLTLTFVIFHHNMILTMKPINFHLIIITHNCK